MRAETTLWQASPGGIVQKIVSSRIMDVLTAKNPSEQDQINE